MRQRRIGVLGCLCLVLAVLLDGGPGLRRVPGIAEAQDSARLQRAGQLNAEALQHLRAWRWADAILKAREALAIRESERGPNHPEVAESLQALADALRENGEFREARPLFERALKIREGTFGPNHPWTAQTLNGFGYLLYFTGDYASARPLLERALKIREQALGYNHQTVSFSLNDLALVLAATGDYAGARALHDRALKIREAAFGPTHPWVALTLNNLAEVHRHTGDYARARVLHERALQIREQALGPEHQAVASSLSNLAFVLWSTGDYARARVLHERALQVRERALGPNHPWVAVSLNLLALVHRTTGEYAAAKPLLERALQIRERALGPGHPDVASSLNELALLGSQTGDYYVAKPLYERALAIREQAFGPAHPAVAATLHNLAVLLQVFGNDAAAKPLFERALAIRERALGASHPDVAFTLQSLGYLARRAGDLTAARPLMQRALAIREQALGPDHPWVATSLGNLAYLLRDSGDVTGARPLFERSLQIARSGGAAEWRWRAAWALGGILEREQRLAEALPFYLEAMKTIEGLASQFGQETQRSQYLQADNRLGVYDALARLLLKLHERDGGRGYDREAWAVLEAKKGRVVSEALAAARPRPRDPQAQRAVQDAQAKQDRVTALEQAIREEQAKAPQEQQAERLQNLTTLMAQTKTEYLAQVQAFLGQYPQYKTLFVDQQTVDPKTLAKFAERLPAGTLVVQYFAAPDALYLFVVAPGGLFKVKSQAVSQGELYELVRQYRQHLDRGAKQRLAWADDGSEAYRQDVAPLKELTRKLATHLLQPIEVELAATRALVLIPNDLLLYAPIHALTRTLPDGSVRFLTETHAVSYLTQLELVDLLKPAQPPAQVSLLALADPDGSLPGAAREVRALLRARSAVTVLEGSQATKERFLTLAPQFPHLHLATHGVLDPQRPERSYLLMAGGQDGDERLGIAEIAGLNLKNGLAILSACETAVGEQVPGAALITLAAAFSQAGAESIVASLWKVNDAATRDLMVAFHRALTTTGRALALQQAQIEVLRNPQTAHPYYWAPFILIGAR